jgi:hypothetical protein
LTGLSAHQHERDTLVAQITANARNPFSKEYLEVLGDSNLEQLRGIAALSAQPVSPPTANAGYVHLGGTPMFNPGMAPVPNYAGSAGPAPTVNAAAQGSGVGPLGLPHMEFAPQVGARK